MDSGRSTRALPRVGFPIRKAPDQRMVSSFPGLIAAAHVLHRLLAPRHPPCDVLLLIRKSSTSQTPIGVRAPIFPRKEVIQPQLPLPLPCYDFTPIINPTFDGCLPEGLAHRLRVLPTFVV